MLTTRRWLEQAPALSASLPRRTWEQVAAAYVLLDDLEGQRTLAWAMHERNLSAAKGQDEVEESIKTSPARLEDDAKAHIQRALGLVQETMDNLEPHTEYRSWLERRRRVGEPPPPSSGQAGPSG
jgi:hypothetical protein